MANGNETTDFQWNRISEYDFVENQDFITAPQKYGTANGGRPSTEYFITLDMAKELSMVERNERN